MVTILVSIFVLAACVVMAWSISETGKAQAKDNYVEYFMREAAALLDREDFNPAFKEFLLDVASNIQNRNVADAVARDAEGREERTSEESRILDLLRGIEANPTEQQMRFVGAMYYFLMALSYSSPRYGGNLRQRLRGELSNQRALLQEGARVYKASHSLTSFAPAA